ncbi:uncharacterized protein LOC133871676 [Alnus glutinosa]|uniref:uncharacterized protein LOC133871676 n=1 Tax=Alnus glutinosa TaxID=3517 RepID=UPI002D79CDB7|nr:uncharacterized protein LOC133871676 [Alnus glutinosa]
MAECSISNAPLDWDAIEDWGLKELNGKEECHNSSPKTKESIMDCIRWEARSRLVANGEFKHLNHSLVFRWNLHTSVGLAAFAVDLVALVLLTSATCLLRIWEDAWLSSPQSRLTLPNNLGWPSDTRVSRLIDTTTGWWDLELIQRIFDHGEVAQIDRVLPSPLKQPDKLIWRGTPSSIFTAKSAYNLEVRRRSQEQGESSMADSSKEGCPAAVGVWQEGSRKIQKLSCNSTDGRGLLLFFLDRLEIEEMLEALTMTRMIWHWQNTFVFQGVFRSPTQVMAAVHMSLVGFSQAIKKAAKPSNIETVPVPQWSKPPHGYWKINWDAAISKEKGKMRVDVVIRDEDGRVVAARAKVVSFITEPDAAKSVAAWFAVEFGRKMGCRRLILEGDSMVVVLALCAKASCSRAYGQVLEDTITRFSHFSSVDVLFACRDANQAANVLAKCALSQWLDNTWISECPFVIQHVVATDL